MLLEWFFNPPVMTREGSWFRLIVLGGALVVMGLAALWLVLTGHTNLGV